MISLQHFDAIVIHYSVRLCFNAISDSLAKRLREFQGVKILFIQDEYEFTETARGWIERLGINVIYSCVPPASVDRVYPSARFPDVEVVSTLTGFAPIPAATTFTQARPIRDRQWHIGYRGRPLSWRFGHLGREKVEIGRRMHAICQQRGVPANIAWEEHERIYGNDWPAFLSDCRAMLATESGSNVFDDDGSITERVAEYQRQHPEATYEDVHAAYIGDVDGQVVMNQISPKVFEAIACRTALVMFEGRYSDVVQPGVHFIPLKKDFSNVDDVLAQVADDRRLEDVTQRAFDDVIASGQYSYPKFVEEFDALLQRKIGRGRGAIPVLSLAGFRTSDAGHNQLNDACLGAMPTVDALGWKDSVDALTPPVSMRLFWKVSAGLLRKTYRGVRRRLSWDSVKSYGARLGSVFSRETKPRLNPLPAGTGSSNGRTDPNHSQ